MTASASDSEQHGADDLAAVWRSGDAELVLRTLAHLLTVLPPRPEISAPAPEVLDVFGDTVPSDAVRNYIWVVGSYRPIHPDLDAREVVERWVEAVIRTGDASAALQVALYLEPTDMPAGAQVVDALSYIATRGLTSARERDGAEYLLRHFLDITDTYDRALQAVRGWRDDLSLSEILDRVEPYVREEDRERLGA